jgi:hypothetical protein
MMRTMNFHWNNAFARVVRTVIGAGCAAVLIIFSPVGWAAADTLLFPDGRQSVEVRPSERNPFGQQVALEVQSTTAGTQDSVSEESRLRRILRALKISGVSGQGQSRRVLIGSLILKPGDLLPPLISNQAESLRVLGVDASQVTLEFLEKDPAAESRKIILFYGLAPTVTQFLFGEAAEDLAQIGPKGQSQIPALTSPEVSGILQKAQDAELKNLVDRNVRMMGVVHDVPPPNQSQ